MLAHFNCADAGVLGRFLAVCLLSALILGAVFDWLLAIGVGLFIAACYVGVVRGDETLRRRLRRDSQTRVDRPRSP